MPGTLLTAYIAGGLIATAGAAFDPWGPMEMLNSGALSSFGAAAGLLWVPRWFSAPGATGITRNYPWIVGAGLVSVLYIFVLGPGITAHF